MTSNEPEVALIMLIEATVKKDMQDLESEISSIIGVMAKNDHLREEAELFKGLADYLSREGSLKGASDVAATINAIGNINSQIDILDNKLTATIGTLISNLRSAFNTLKTKLQNLCLHLWQLLSQLMKPKEWSIKGDAGIGNFFGLSGNVQIQIVFGA